MLRRIILAVTLIHTAIAGSSANELSVKCHLLSSTYLSGELRDTIAGANSTNLAPADFYDNVACECRLNQQQTIGQAALKAISAINAGLWAAEPMHHDLSPKERREAEAFNQWMQGKGKRPNMNGIPACAYSRPTR